MLYYYSLGLLLAIGTILVNSGFPAQPVQTTAATVGVADGTAKCVDKIPECARLGFEICSDPNYTKFVTENCCKHCSLHTVQQVQTISDAASVADGATTQMDCVDEDPQCGQLGHDACTEPLFVEWALQKCRKTCGLCNGIPSTTPSMTTRPAVTVSAVKTPPTPACVDKAPNCDSYSLNDCIKYGAWAKDNCAKYCSLCGDSNCRDELVNCVDYGKDACTKYPQWATDKCAKYCDLCPGKTNEMLVPTTTAPKVTGCIDKLPNCAGYDSNICTDHRYAQWSRENCPEHCNMCTPGCYFNGSVYKQSEVFKDACKLKCTCRDAATGQFACTSMCYSWNLPDICTMEPPKPGKCCPQPKCPDNVHITYPDGYTVD